MVWRQHKEVLLGAESADAYRYCPEWSAADTFVLQHLETVCNEVLSVDWATLPAHSRATPPKPPGATDATPSDAKAPAPTLERALQPLHRFVPLPRTALYAPQYSRAFPAAEDLKATAELSVRHPLLEFVGRLQDLTVS